MVEQQSEDRHVIRLAGVVCGGAQVFVCARGVGSDGQQRFRSARVPPGVGPTE